MDTRPAEGSLLPDGMNETADKTLKVCQMKIMANLCKRIYYLQQQVAEVEEATASS